MRTRLLLTIPLALALFAGGCKKSDEIGNPSTDFQTDEAYIAYAVANLDSVADYSEAEQDAINDDSLQDLEYQIGFAKVGNALDPISPLRWGRRVESVIRTVTVRKPDDSTAIATIQKVASGMLFIRAERDSAGILDTVLVTKTFTDTLKRKTLFVRIGQFQDRRRNWRPAAITLVEGKSPSTDFAIDSLVISTPRDVYVVTDPLTTWLRFGRGSWEILRTRPDDPVQFRVVISSQTDSAEAMFLHWGVGPRDNRRHRARIPLVSSSSKPGGGWTRVFERTFYAHRHYGRFNAIIDVLSYGTLFVDDPAIYSNRLWGLPYVAAPF